MNKAALWMYAKEIQITQNIHFLHVTFFVKVISMIVTKTLFDLNKKQHEQKYYVEESICTLFVDFSRFVQSSSSRWLRRPEWHVLPGRGRWGCRTTMRATGSVRTASRGRSGRWRPPCSRERTPPSTSAACTGHAGRQTSCANSSKTAINLRTAAHNHNRTVISLLGFSPTDLVLENKISSLCGDIRCNSINCNTFIVPFDSIRLQLSSAVKMWLCCILEMLCVLCTP